MKISFKIQTTGLRLPRQKMAGPPARGVPKMVIRVNLNCVLPPGYSAFFAFYTCFVNVRVSLSALGHFASTKLSAPLPVKKITNATL